MDRRGRNRSRSRSRGRNRDWPTNHRDDRDYRNARQQTPSPIHIISGSSLTTGTIKQQASEEWICIKCTMKNFNRRGTCFKCGITRYDSDNLGAKGYSMVGVVPSDTLLVRELPSTATEESIELALFRYSGIPVKRIHIAPSRMYAFAQVKNPNDAAFMLESFHKMIPHIDNCAVIVTYSKRSLNEIIFSGNYEIPPAPVRMPANGEQQPIETEKSTVITPFGQYSVFAPPEPKSFQFDENTGYYLDKKTGFYYDAKTDYYYNSKTNQWMFWCSKYNTYINCEGGDLKLKAQLQDDERENQFRRKQKDAMDGGRGRESTTQKTLRNLSDSGAGREIGTGTSSSRISSIQQNLLECLRQNKEFLASERDDLLSARDHIKIEKIRSHIDMLLKQRETIKSSLAELTTSAVVEPQLKRHITQAPIAPPPRPPSVVELSDDEDDHQYNWDNKKRKSEKKRGKIDTTWRSEEGILGRTAYDKHVEEAEKKLRSNRGEKRSDRVISDSSDPVQTALSTGIQAQIREMVDRRFQEGWRNHELRGEQKRRSPSPQRRREKSSGSPPNHDDRRHRSRSRSRNQPRRTNQSRERADLHRQSLSFVPPGHEPMAISPQPQEMMRGKLDESWNGRMPNWPLPAMPIGGLGGGTMPSGPFPPMSFASSMPGSSNGMDPSAIGAFQTPSIPHQFMGNGGPSAMMPLSFGTTSRQMPLPIPGMTPMGIPGIPPAAMFGPPKQFFQSNEDHWRIAASQQSRFPGAMSTQNSMQSSLGSAPKGSEIQICSLCDCFGHNRDNCPVESKKVAQQIEMNKKKNEKEGSSKLRDLNICFNCGRGGHSQIGCFNPRISDTELQRKIRIAEEKVRKREMDKESLKKKADKYPVRRKDPFIERLREVAPRGKITKASIRTICARCSSLNHSTHECARPEAPRSLYKQICQALEEFTRIFFVHLNEDNLVDFSQKFDTFIVMDAIEQGGTIDPVGLQLQTKCKDGIVTQGDLRELCSTCANLGHRRHDCKEKETCSPAHYEKMLNLVKGYRALVKEGNGNFLLPSAKHYVPKNIPNNAGSSIPIEEIILMDSSDDDEQESNNGKKPNHNQTEVSKDTGKRNSGISQNPQQRTEGDKKGNTEDPQEKIAEEDDDEITIL